MNLNPLQDREFLSSLQIVDWGYTENPLPKSYQHYTSWLAQSLEGILSYLTGERAQTRKDIRLFYPEFQSALVFLFSYADAKRGLEKVYRHPKWNQLKMAAYPFAFSERDYHHTIRDHLVKMATEIQIKDYALTIDAHPVLERDLAYRAGLGWFGKNSMLIHRDHGSYTLIGSLLLKEKLPNMVLENFETDHCGQCRACVEACPTDAILESDRRLDASKCISTYTIEIFKEANPPPGYDQSHGEIFGCDICQEVCPWNHKEERKNSSQIKEITNTSIVKKLLLQSKDELIKSLNNLSNREFQRQFKQTALERTGRMGVLKNIKALLKRK